jgi:polysaccharide transporter, PST family
MASPEPMDLDAGPLLGLWPRTRRLILSQRRNLQTLSMLVVFNFVAAALGFMTTVKIANTIGKADFGLFAYGFAIAAYGGAIVRFGMDKTLIRDLIHHPDRQEKTIVSSLLLRGILFLVVAAGLIGWKSLSSVSGDLTWGVILIALGQSMLGLELKAVYDSWGKMSLHAAYYLAQRGIYLGAVWFAIAVLPASVNLYLLGLLMLASVGFYLIVQGYWVLQRIQFAAMHFDLKAVWHLARENTVISLSTFGTLTMAVFNQLILKAFCGKESLGGYAAAWQIAAISMLCFDQVSRIGNPATARVTAPGVGRDAKSVFLAKYSLVMFAVALPVTMISAFCPEHVLRLVYNPEYASDAGALRLMGVYTMVYALGLVASQYVIALRKDIWYLASTVIGGILSGALCLVLIPVFQGTGAILALLVSHSCCIALYLAIVFADLGRRA